ncbi:MAG: hypothetical protein GEU86_12215 [Actinophytocola sp.]|nr:hypothetical protein [Actinophytocola sp.]
MSAVLVAVRLPVAQDSIAALDETHRQFLADALGTAKRRQSEDLAAATEGSLQYVPKLLRGPVRRAVGL